MDNIHDTEKQVDINETPTNMVDEIIKEKLDDIIVTVIEKMDKTMVTDKTTDNIIDSITASIEIERKEEQIITPWKVTSTNGINYTKLIKQFGCNGIDGELIKRFERVTNTRAHRFLRRGLFFSHKDLNIVLDRFEKGEQIYLYTGRGPTSASLHLGHMIPFEFTKFLQDAFDAILIIQMSDDEKFYFKEGHQLEHYSELAYENAKDIIAVGFNPDKTYIFLNSNTVEGKLQTNVIKMMKFTNCNMIKSIFGLKPEDCSVGQIAWPIYQSVPAFSNSFPDLFDKDIICLVPMAIDQSPYFRLARDYAGHEKLIKPAEIHSEFLVGLEGINSKMSSSEQAPVIFLTDTKEQIEKKIKKYAFSGGKSTKEEHIKLGADLTVDVSYQYLLYFLEDDYKLEQIARNYKSGKMLTSEIKKITVSYITDYVLLHQKKKALITNDILYSFFNRNRKFDKNITQKINIELFDDEYYNKIGINFNRYFD